MRGTAEARDVVKRFEQTVRVDGEREFTIQRPPFGFFNTDSHAFNWPGVVAVSRAVYLHDQIYTFVIPGKKTEEIQGSDDRGILRAVTKDYETADKKYESKGSPKKQPWCDDGIGVEIDGLKTPSAHYIVMYATRHKERTVVLTVSITPGERDAAFMSKLLPIVRDALGSLSWKKK
jgi:hypothetical protein